VIKTIILHTYNMCTPLSSMFKQLPKPVSVDGINACKREYLSSVMDICTKEMGS
jgi:hypothetical protein